MSKKNVKTTNKVSTTKSITKENFKLSDYDSKSHAIRVLNSKGYSRSEISKIMGIIYQHVRNVLITPLKRDQKKVTK